MHFSLIISAVFYENATHYLTRSLLKKSELKISAQFLHRSGASEKERIPACKFTFNFTAYHFL